QALWAEGGNAGGKFGSYAESVANTALPVVDDAFAVVPDRDYVDKMNKTIQCLFKPVAGCDSPAIKEIKSKIGAGGGAEGSVETARRLQIGNGKWVDDYSRLGWGGAAIWYNKIAQMSGALVASIFGSPVAAQYPEVM